MKRIFLSAAFLICAIITYAQSPDLFNYQAVARDVAGNVMPNANVAVRLTIRDISSTGTILYRERHAVLTNQFGLFTCVIGTGSLPSGSFTTINWADSSKYLQVEFDPTGGLSYTDMGATQFVSVPYAKAADVLNIYPGGTGNSDKMIITHSPSFPTWGLQYQDATDKFNFNAGTATVLSVDLGTRKVGIGTSSPSSQLHVTGSRASEADTGLVTFNNTGTGNTIYASGMGTLTADGAVIAGDNKNAGTGIFGSTTGAGWAIYGYNPAGVAGHFSGDLEVTSGNANVTGDASVTGFTELGTGSPRIKMKKITATTAFQENAAVQISHGLTASKILAVDILVESTASSFVPPNCTYLAESLYDFYVSTSNITVANSTSASSLILSKPVKILITYEE